MADDNALSKELEDQIQSLASEIYIQVEERVASILKVTQQQPISEQSVAAHPLYQTLLAKQQALAAELTSAHQQRQSEQAKHQQALSELQAKLEMSEFEINNIGEANNAKLTDSEQNLKEKEQKLNETEQALKETAASLAIQEQTIAELNHKQSQTLEKLAEVTQQLALAEQENQALATKEQNLLKSEKAKTATLAVQNQYISELNTKLNETNSALEHAQSQFGQQNESMQAALANEQAQNQKLTDDVKQLNIEIKHALAQVSQLQQNLEQAEQDKQVKAQQVSEVTEMNQSLEVQIKQLTDELTQVKDAAEQHRAEIESYQAAERTYQQRLEQANENASNAEREQQKQHHHVKALQDQVATLTEKVTIAQKQHESDDVIIHELTDKLAAGESQFTEKIDALTKQVSLLKNQLTKEEQHSAQQQLTLDKLNTQVKQALASEQRAEERLISAKQRFEQDNNTTRETIKYLRDENLALNAKHAQELTELEDKLREYRLRFEYAQQQLQQK